MSFRTRLEWITEFEHEFNSENRKNVIEYSRTEEITLNLEQFKSIQYLWKINEHVH